MKKTVLLFAAVTIATITNAQTTWRVNNNPSADAHVTTLQAAHDTASAGDIIYLEPSGTSYDTCTFTKQLTVIGPGYFLAENDTTAFHNEAMTGNIIFNVGSEGTILMGLYINGVVEIKADNIALKRNRIEGRVRGPEDEALIMNRANNTFITQCFAYNNNGGGSYPGCLYSIGLNLTLQNCFLQITEAGANTEIYSGSGTINNNIFTNSTVEIKNSSFINNIYKTITDKGGNIITNNLIYADSLFIGGTSPDGKYQLAADSPAIGAGKDGVDCGMFGGSEPYVISGIPSIPSIIDVSMPTSGSQAGGLPVTIKIQSNN